MPKIGLFYSTETGMNEGVAKMIAEMMPGELDVFMEITKASVDDAASCDCLLIGMPTHGEGEMQEGWADFYPNLDSIDFSGKIVALFGLGDQVGYGHEFVDGLRLLYDKFVKRGATMVGRWPTDGYDFSHSEAIVDGQFVGLVIDEQNQLDQTPEQVDAVFRPQARIRAPA